MSREKTVAGLSDALDWAADLALRHEKMTREQLRDAWDGDAGKKNRAILREHSPDLFGQLIDLLTLRRKALEAEA